MNSELEKVLREKLHKSGSSHTMDFKECNRCDLGDAFSEIDRLRLKLEHSKNIIKDLMNQKMEMLEIIIRQNRELDSLKDE